MTNATLHLQDDQTLMSLLRADDLGAFEEVYRRYWTVIYDHAFRLLQEEEETRDVVQEVFTTLWLKRADLVSNDNLAGFLYITARRKVLDLLAHRKAQGKYLDTFFSSIATIYWRTWTQRN